MKKWIRIFAIVLAAFAIAMMLPMGSVQALREKSVIRPEPGTDQEISEVETEEPEEAEPKPEIPKEEGVLEEPTETVTEAEEYSEQTESVQLVNFSLKKDISVKIEDDIEKGLIYQNDRYFRKITHTITLTRKEDRFPYTNSEIYENISYIIYQKTDAGEISLKKGSLKIPDEIESDSINTIEAVYTQVGNYCIRVQRKWKEETIEELFCHDFSIEKDTQKIVLKEDTKSLHYGDVIFIDDLVDKGRSYICQEEYEIREENEEKNKILEIAKEGDRTYIKANGMNGASVGTARVKIRLKETEFTQASNEEMLIVYVNPIELTMEVQTDVSEVYLYDTLMVKVSVQKDGKDITEELFETDKGLQVGFTISCGTSSFEINSKEIVSYIPVDEEHFKAFFKGARYNISVGLRYEDEKEYVPYKVNTVDKYVELLGRRAVIKLSAECNGIYDYHTYYQGTMPMLKVELKDVTASSNECDTSNKTGDTGQKALLAEAENIVYHITSTNKNVASADSLRQYTAADEDIPLRINGVGAATLTVTASGDGVYTVESSEINIVVKNSPLYDEDFVISVIDAGSSKEQIFNGSKNKTGFEKWQEYLGAHRGWINGSVKVCLTELGSKYYELLDLTANGQYATSSQQLSVNGDKKMEEYTFGASNSLTNANTENSEDKENGVRRFQMGIDTTPPVVKSFLPSTDYYMPTCTEEQQYFPKSFVLTGSFTDATSGITAIEYTTEINAEDKAKWILLEKDEEAKNEKYFRLVLGDGSYNAIAVRAIDAAGNISETACLKNEKGAFIKIIVDSAPPEIDVSMTLKENEDTWHPYSAENENWTNKEIKILSMPVNGVYAELYRIEYTYQSIAAALSGEPIEDDQWQELVVDEQGIAELSVGGDPQNLTNKNGFYYFRGVSASGVKSASNTEKRILLWQKMADKNPVVESGANLEKCYNEWYNKESGTPVIDFAYPEYDTGVISGEYAAPVTIHYNLIVKDEKDVITSLADNKTATIQADFPQNISPTGFPVISDDIAQLQAKLSDDGIYTLEYWVTDAAGNESETEIHTYQIDCHEPSGLKVILDGVEQAIENESTLVYDKFYQNSVSGEASAEYGISGKNSIKLLKAKKVGEWKERSLTEDAEQFKIEPDMRCLLYIRAVDGAGNMTEGWTRGIVVDNEAPTGEGTPRLIVEPEGANKHGFFNKDVKVKISIKDVPNDGNCAGLKLVTGSVGSDDGNAISDKELFSSMEEQVSESLMSETEGFSIVETIDAKANEGNHAYITVNAADRSENVSTDTRELKIDVTKPEIEITFDNENAVNGKYYNADRRAKINIREFNFDASLVRIKATRNGGDYVPPISDWQSDKNNHYAYIDFSADGDYTLTVECTDLADNKADQERAEPFTIDKTEPKVELALEGGRMQNEYFNETQTAVITVIEHNFNADDFYIDIQPAGKIGSWEHKNDTHVIKIEALQEGEYAVLCDYKDLAGNGIADEDKIKMPLAFVIDTTNPVIAISGVENNSANAGTVIPNITVQDRYIELTDVTIMFTTGRGMVADISSDITTALTDGGFVYTLNGLDAKQDDIYYLSVNASDKAGNVSELTYRFSLNRRGSAYDLTDLTKFKERYYNSYKNIEDIKIVEMNVDKVEEFSLYLSHNADIIYGKSGSRPFFQDESKVQEAVLYSVDVSGNEDTGYVYTYTIYRENFAREGTYRLGIYSKDAAGNEVNNLLKQNGEEIQFVVDNTIPRVVIDGVENNEIYDVSSQEVRVVADDNFKLAEAELMLVNKDDEVLESWNYFDLVEKEGDTALITIQEHNEEVSLLYRAVDAAGNEVRTLPGEKEAKADFLVTTDKLVQLVHKPTQAPVGRGIVIALIVSLVGIVLTFVLLKKATPNE